jgi:hypothetical protein
VGHAKHRYPDPDANQRHEKMTLTRKKNYITLNNGICISATAFSTCFKAAKRS